MDKKTIKTNIIELKDSGKTYQEISDILYREYGVQMSRQAVHGMYKRLTSDVSIQTNRDIILATTDIMNYHVIGLDTSQIKTILANRGLNLSIARLEDIISDNSDYESMIYNDLLHVVGNRIKNGDDLDGIIKVLTYKGESPSINVINKFINDYATEEIKANAIKTLASVFHITEDKSLVKSVSNKFNIKLTAKELGKALNI